MNFKDIKSIEDVKLTTEYVPYVTKVAECKSIADVTSHKEVAGKKIFVADSTTRHLFYTMKLISLYTDVEFGDDEVVNAYDELNKKQLLYLISEELIPESELIEFKNIMELVLNDIYENERSVGAILGVSKEAIGMTIGSIFDGIQNAFEKNEVPENEDIEIKLTTDDE